ncbi:hypothetical protein OJF2_19970 [Aquisphaera giovannonii]|uniref:Uncharacterized protein n=1 Tax=Aquisphaera giovannonii TaxID=406548 RepID=A0A5B9W0L4_9BACT|nr:hypothetical protein [Aquisphaera giovannonii]QEH33495.1 hypothetical protein OJF2_19970 [Aquisphaera giovannonii]
MPESARVLDPQDLGASPRRLLDPASRAIAYGLPGLGLVLALRAVLLGLAGGLLSPILLAVVVCDATFVAGAYALAGMVLAALVRAVGDWLSDTRNSATAPVTTAAAPGPSSVLDSPPAPASPTDQPVPVDDEPAPTPKVALAPTGSIRRSIVGRNWDEAENLLFDLEAESPEDPRLDALREELRLAQEAARDEHLLQIGAAREVNDPERVLELHGLVAPLLDAAARDSLESDLSRWLLHLVHNRLRTGKIQGDLVQLAGRIAEAFSHTPDGASLRASLPTLRRSAGLCPRCAKPYVGLGNACPECLARAQAPYPVRVPDEEPGS